MLNLKEDKRIYLKYEEIEKIFGSCDICHKNSSFANRTCNKCFYKLIGEYSKEVPKITVLEGNPKIEKWCKEFQKLNKKIIKLMSDNNEM